MCPGVHVAERSLFINVSRVLWGFNIVKKTGLDGNVIEPTQEMMKGFFSVPIPFECEILPRSDDRAKVMKDEFAKAEKAGMNF